MNPSYGFREQVALVTGASAGMSLATDAVTRAARALTDAVYKALAVTCDVRPSPSMVE